MVDLTGLGGVADFAKSVVDRIWPPAADPKDKLAAQVAMEQLLESRESQLLDTQKSIIVAELQQGDKYTKRARPSIIYMGLGSFALVSVIVPVCSWVLTLCGLPNTLPDIKFPEAFWAAWGATASVWSLGRTAERWKIGGKLLNIINGNSK
uniref:Putative holin n=1 Tax=viral metagenome TaxID=1070528 RepID=A0A6M3IIH3_9ZZZZ